MRNGGKNIFITFSFDIKYITRQLVVETMRSNSFIDQYAIVIFNLPLHSLTIFIIIKYSTHFYS
jgi:hypothetical protein